MTSFMFQEQNGIKLCLGEQEKDHQGARGEARNVDICWYWVSGGQEGYLHMELIIPSIIAQRVSSLATRLSKY